LRRRNHSLDKARVIVTGVAGQALVDLVERQLRQDGDAVERFLAMDREIVAELFECFARKAVVDGFGLLQADNVRLSFGQPGARGVDARSRWRCAFGL
jgi:hypothetical protein